MFKDIAQYLLYQYRTGFYNIIHGLLKITMNNYTIKYNLGIQEKVISCVYNFKVYQLNFKLNLILKKWNKNVSI